MGWGGYWVGCDWKEKPGKNQRLRTWPLPQWQSTVLAWHIPDSGSISSVLKSKTQNSEQSQKRPTLAGREEGAVASGKETGDLSDLDHGHL